MNIYLAVDASVSMLLQDSKGESAIKTGTTFVTEFIEAVDKREVDITVVLLNNAPKILCDDVSNVADAKKALSENNEECGLPDYLALQELIQARHSVSNFELIVVTSAKDYYSISESFLLPCLVRFVIIGDEAKSSGRMLADFLAITTQCATNTGISKDAGEQWNLAPSFIQDAKTAAQTAKRLAAEKRTHPVARFNLSSLVSFDVRLTPGVPKTPIAIIGSEVVEKHIAPDQPPTFNLLGFVKLTMLPNIPSSTLMHLASVPVLNDADEQLRTTFHLMAESLGSEGNVAVFQHSSGEECFLKPVRYDVNESWKLVLLWIDSSSFKWQLASGPVEKPSTSLAEEYGLSYKVSATRTYWTDSHGIQSDIIKLARSLRRIDRLDQFYADLRRISVYALACGYESFAPELAAILEKKSATTDPELKAHIAKATTALRTGGFKLIAGKDAH